MLFVLSKPFWAISVAILLQMFISVVISKSRDSHSREIDPIDGTSPPSQSSLMYKKKIDSFLKVYRHILRDSMVYRKSGVGDRFVLDEQIEDLRQLLEQREIKKEEDSDIIRWVPQLLTLSDSQLWQTMNLFFSGNFYSLNKGDYSIKARASRDEL